MTLTQYIDSYLEDCNLEKFTSNDFLIQDILNEYGVDTEDKATDLTKLYKITRYFVWKKGLVSHSKDFDFSADGSSFKTSQLYEFAKEKMLDCYVDALPYLKDYQISVEETYARPHTRHF